MTFITITSTVSNAERIDGQYQVAVIDASYAQVSFQYAQVRSSPEYWALNINDLVNQQTYFGAPLDRVVFSQPMSNTISLHGGSTLAEMAWLANFSYTNPQSGAPAIERLEAISFGISQGLKSHNWHPLSALELGMHFSGANTPGGGTITPGENLAYIMRDGHYTAFDRTKSFASSHADAIVATGIVDGKRSLVVSFRGTDDIATDGFDFFDMSAHYRKFAPLVQGIKDYIGDTRNGIEQILVTGHSLGGSMVQNLLQIDFAGMTNVRGFTFGSPGTDFPAVDANDRRIVNIIQNDDPVPDIPSFANFADGVAPALFLAFPNFYTAGLLALSQSYEPKVRGGADIRVYAMGAPFEGGFSAHDIGRYVGTTMDLQNAALDATSIFYSHPVSQALRAGQQLPLVDLTLRLGDSSSNTLLSTASDHYILAQGGADSITVAHALGEFLHTINIDGGANPATPNFFNLDMLLMPRISIRDVHFERSPNGNIRVVGNANGTVYVESNAVEHFVLADAFFTDSGAPDVKVATGSGGLAQNNDSLEVLDARGFFGQVVTNARVGVVLGGAGSVVESYVTDNADTLVAGSVQSPLGVSSHQRSTLQPFGLGGVNGTVLNGWSGTDTLIGAALDDVMIVNDDGDRIVGGGGYDYAVLYGFSFSSTRPYQLPSDVEEARLFTKAFIAAGSTNTKLLGSGDGDSLNGGIRNDTIDGQGGNDILVGGAGVDVLRGSDGNDIIYFDPQDAVIDGGNGFDTGRAVTNAGLAIRMDAWNVEQLFAGGGNDVIFTFGTAAYRVDGGGGNDSISGNVFGDVLGGNIGNDVLDGRQGNDTLGGGFGSDRLLGGEGADTLFGEADPDSYIYRGLIDAGDTIIGFETAASRGTNGDKIEIVRSGFLQPGQANLGALDPARFVAGPATLATGQFLFDTNTGRLFWDGDGTGAGVAQLLLTVQGVNNLSAADFVLV